MFTWWRTNGERRATSASRIQGVEDQAERADLVLRAVVIVLVELSGPAVEDLPGQGSRALPVNLPGGRGFLRRPDSQVGFIGPNTRRVPGGGRGQ